MTGFVATTRRSLRAIAARSDGNDDETALIAQTLRRVSAARGTLLRRALVAEVAYLLTPVLEDMGQNVLATIDDEIDALVDLGDLVLHQAAEKRPRTVDLGSGALVRLESNAGALLLGRIEAALPAYVRKAIRMRRHIRSLPADALDQGVIDEVQFQGCCVIEWRTWSEVPEQMPAALLLSRTLQRGARFSGDGSSFEVFDPKSDPWFYMARSTPGALMSIVERDRWAAAKGEGTYGQRTFSLFGYADGQLRRADVGPGEFIRVLAACASIGGGALVARRAGDQFRLHFPPPWWLRRLLAIGFSVQRDGALVGVETPPAMTGAVLNTLEKILFCDVRSEQNGEWR